MFVLVGSYEVDLAFAVITRHETNNKCKNLLATKKTQFTDAASRSAHNRQLLGYSFRHIAARREPYLSVSQILLLSETVLLLSFLWVVFLLRCCDPWMCFLIATAGLPQFLAWQARQPCIWIGVYAVLDNQNIFRKKPDVPRRFLCNLLALWADKSLGRCKTSGMPIKHKKRVNLKLWLHLRSVLLSLAIMESTIWREMSN